MTTHERPYGTPRRVTRRELVWDVIADAVWRTITGASIVMIGALLMWGSAWLTVTVAAFFDPLTWLAASLVAGGVWGLVSES